MSCTKQKRISDRRRDQAEFFNAIDVKRTSRTMRARRAVPKIDKRIAVQAPVTISSREIL
jgi:hypothetical protein